MREHKKFEWMGGCLLRITVRPSCGRFRTEEAGEHKKFIDQIVKILWISQYSASGDIYPTPDGEKWQIKACSIV